MNKFDNDQWVTSTEQSFQDQVARMMALVEALAQQAAMANKVLEEARAEIEAKIEEPHKENQILKEIHKPENDPFNLEHKEMEDNISLQEVEQAKPKTLVQQKVDEILWHYRKIEHSDDDEDGRIQILTSLWPCNSGNSWCKQIAIQRMDCGRA